MKLIVVLLMTGAVWFGSIPGARATSTPWGDPVLGHSWDQLWVETSDLDFDNLIARIAAPPEALFQSPGFLGFSVDSWVITSSSAREMRAQGADTGRLEFTTHFTGLPSDYSGLNPLILDLYFLNGSSVVDSHRWIWDGAVWVDPPAPGLPDGGTTLLLLGLSTLGIGWVRRKLDRA